MKKNVLGIILITVILLLIVIFVRPDRQNINYYINGFQFTLDESWEKPKNGNKDLEYIFTKNEGNISYDYLITFDLGNKQTEVNKTSLLQNYQGLVIDNSFEKGQTKNMLFNIVDSKTNRKRNTSGLGLENIYVNNLKLEAEELNSSLINSHIDELFSSFKKASKFDESLSLNSNLSPEQIIELAIKVDIKFNSSEKTFKTIQWRVDDKILKDVETINIQTTNQMEYSSDFLNKDNKILFNVRTLMDILDMEPSMYNQAAGGLNFTSGWYSTSNSNICSYSGNATFKVDDINSDQIISFSCGALR